MKSCLKIVGAVLVFSLVGVSVASAFDHSHQQFSRLLQDHVVTNGLQSAVQYGEILQSPDRLDRYIDQIERVTQEEFKSWSEQQQIAFLLNAYNALTIKLILSNYPDLKSIKDLGGFFSGPWKIKFFTLLGEARHLDYIEHEVLRKEYTEPRIHFALVCASIGCPPLQPEAFQADILDQQLQDVMLSFLSDPERNRYEQSTQRLYLSSIFKWFKKDFVKTEGSVEAFVAPWITDDTVVQQQIRNKQVPITYLDYDWSLNRAE